MKMAAAEGLHDGGNGVPFTIVGDLKIPKMLSILATHDIDGYVPGINNLLEGGYQMPDGTTALSAEEKIKRGQIAIAALDAFRKAHKAGDEASAAVARKTLDENVKYFGYGYIKDPTHLVPNVELTFWSFRIMVGTYYVRRQLSQATPLLPLDLLRIPIFRLSILTSICSFIAQMSAMVSLPFFLQNTLGHSEVMTGLLLTPWPLATLVTAPLAGYLVERIHPGILGSVGMVLFAVGLFSLSGLTAESSDISLILRLMLCGAGFGLFQTPNNSTIISSAPTKRSGGASGMLGMARLLGQTSGTTLVALLFSFVIPGKSTAVCLIVGSIFAVVAAIVSSLRLSQPSTLKNNS